MRRKCSSPGATTHHPGRKVQRTPLPSVASNHVQVVRVPDIHAYVQCVAMQYDAMRLHLPAIKTEQRVPVHVVLDAGKLAANLRSCELIDQPPSAHPGAHPPPPSSTAKKSFPELTVYVLSLFSATNVFVEHNLPRLRHASDSVVFDLQPHLATAPDSRASAASPSTSSPTPSRCMAVLFSAR
jgi:hypothetical protein